MKKNYLFLLVFLISLAQMNAQTDINITFESSEGYSLGLIDGQNGWLTNPDYSSSMVISDNESFVGEQSLHFQADPNGPVPNNGLAPALLNLTGLSGNVSFTADLFFETGDEISDSEFGLILQSPTQGLITSRIAFFGGEIFVLNTNPDDPNTLTFQSGGLYPTGEWFEFKIEHNFDSETIVYSVDGVGIFTGDAFGADIAEQFWFLSTFNQTGAYVDNLRFESGTLSTNTETAISFSIYPNPTSDILNIQSPNTINVEAVKIIDINGKQKKAQLNNNQIDVSNLQSGMYMLNIQTDQGNETLKFMKN